MKAQEYAETIRCHQASKDLIKVLKRRHTVYFTLMLRTCGKAYADTMNLN